MQFPGLFQTEITKKVGEMWQQCSEEEKAPYVALSKKDKQRYMAELEAYSCRMRAQNAQAIADATGALVSAAMRAASSGNPMSAEQLELVGCSPPAAAGTRISCRCLCGLRMGWSCVHRGYGTSSTVLLAQLP